MASRNYERIKARAKQSNISSNITFLPRWMKCWNGLPNYKICKVPKKKKKSCWMMLDEVCSRRKFHPTCFDAKVWIFHVGLVWCGVSSNIHKILLISNVCKFELQFEFLNVFLNFEFRFNLKYLSWMRKVQDHVLELYCKTMYYYYKTMYHVLKFLTIFPFQIYKSFVHEIIFEIVSNCFSHNRWIVPTSWNLKQIEWIRGNIITPLPF